MGLDEQLVGFIGGAYHAGTALPLVRTGNEYYGIYSRFAQKAPVRSIGGKPVLDGLSLLLLDENVPMQPDLEAVYMDPLLAALLIQTPPQTPYENVRDFDYSVPLKDITIYRTAFITSGSNKRAERPVFAGSPHAIRAFRERAYEQFRPMAERCAQQKFTQGPNPLNSWEDHMTLCITAHALACGTRYEADALVLAHVPFLRLDHEAGGVLFPNLGDFLPPVDKTRATEYIYSILPQAHVEFAPTLSASQ